MIQRSNNHLSQKYVSYSNEMSRRATRSELKEIGTILYGLKGQCRHKLHKTEVTQTTQIKSRENLYSQTKSLALINTMCRS